MTRTVRALRRPELDTLLDWAAAEGWNPGLHDANAFWAADPNGFFGAFVDGVMVAGISAVAYGSGFGFIGLYICHPDHRGHGHGKAVWTAGMAYLGRRTIGLDGVPAQRDNYASMGFVTAYDTIRMRGTIDGPAERTELDVATALVALDTFDKQCFPADRSAFLRHWVAPPHQAIIRHTNGETSASAVRRPCIDGHKFGPLFAKDLASALSVVQSEPGLVHIDVPTFQTEFLSHLSALGFVESFATSRMYRGPAPAIHLPYIYGITSLELG